jgi:NAD(P)-dependent dehydrogenase (short-subunit alcohol dehydrogenase family)
VDIIVNNAGISTSKPIADHTIADWDKLYDILVKGQFLVSQAGIAVMRKQNIGGDIINIVSKNAVVAGPNNAGYGSAKAAQAHLTRLMAAELGADKIRVNTVNPDAVIADSNIWAGGCRLGARGCHPAGRRLRVGFVRPWLPCGSGGAADDRSGSRIRRRYPQRRHGPGNRAERRPRVRDGHDGAGLGAR